MAKQVAAQWYDILTPEYFGGKIMGQTTANEPEKLVGRVVEMSLSELTGEASRYYVKIFLKANRVEGTKILTSYFGHDCTRDFIARVVQLRTDRIDTNNIIELKDAKIRLKTLAITNRCVRKGTEKDLRKAISEAIKKELENSTLEEFIRGMITGSSQKKIRKIVSKIYPLRQFEFRNSKVL
ncbi:MAG: hypothetical protein PHU12_02665 [Candidatus Aenigmarchaeota archaeon]|nr:hypothetical protein [Candidatus Aenigmarchaeota archaeon]